MAIARRYQQLRLDIKRVAYTLKHSITKRLLVVVFSIYLVVTIVVTIVHMEYEYEFSKHQTIQALKNVQEMIYESLSQAIWEFNTPQIDTIINGLYTNQYIVGVKLTIPANDAVTDLSNKQVGLIENDSGDILYADPKTNKTEPFDSTFERLIPDKFDIQHVDALHRKLTIGTMYLYSSNKIVFKQVEISYILILINAFIKTLALWVFFLWAGYYFISKPLAKLNNAIKELAVGNWDTELSANSKNPKQKTEINTLFETFNDMTKNLQTTQNKLQTSRNRLNNIFDTMPSSLAWVDDKNIVLGWNKYMAILTGIDQKHAIGKNLRNIFPGFNEYGHLISDAVSQNKEQQVQHVKIQLGDLNANKLFHVTAYPIKDSSPPEAVIRIDDVTEQVKNEADMAQVEKLASVGASIAGVTHEINNPLGSIMQSTQNILRRIDPGLESNKQTADKLHIDLQQQYKYLEEREIIKFLTSIHDAGERASSIVKNMLKFTRRSTAEMSKHNIVDIINDSLLLCANDVAIMETIDFKDIQINKNLCADNLSIECYPLEIQQVILNIVRNAAQAIPPTQAKKIIGIDLANAADNKIVIKISDNGPGMEQEISQKIFEPFFTTKPVGQGTGLGLSVCRNIIVQKHHGTLEVESAVGKGSTFIITLPVKQRVD